METQVVLCQNDSFFHQLGQNLTTDFVRISIPNKIDMEFLQKCPKFTNVFNIVTNFEYLAKASLAKALMK